MWTDVLEKPKIYHKPVLGYIVVGHDKSQEIYVKNKFSACQEIGID